MTNEEKLLKLLQIAVENGWKDEKDFISNLDSVDNNFIYVDDVDFVGTLHSVNDLVTNFEEGEVSFIEALCKSCNMKGYKPIFSSEINNTSYSFVAHFIRQDWIYYPTSQRLDWLFETFKHLL